MALHIILAAVLSIMCGISQAQETQVQMLIPINTTIDVMNIEASGIAWLPEQHQYLLVSDEAYDEKPGLFALSADLQQISQIALPEDLKVDDFESISVTDTYIYVLSSLAYNKKGELKDKRKKLLRFTYQHGVVSDLQSIDFFALLTAIQQAAPQSALGEFLALGMDSHSIDIEAHFVHDGQLYVGFKNPLDKANNNVIVKLEGIDALFSGKQPTASIWAALNLTSPEGHNTHISDALYVNNTLYLLSVSRSEQDSYLWRYALADKRLQLLKTFKALKAEGLGYRADTQQFIVVFDAGKRNLSRYQFLSLF